MTALLVSLINLSLSCYPEKLDYVDQILAYAKDKVLEFSDSPDLHSKATEGNLLGLLLAPIQHYTSVLYLLALANYQPLLALQPYGTRQSAAHAVVNSVLKNNTIIDIPEDVYGTLDLCDVLLRDQKDAPATSAPSQQNTYGGGMRHKPAELSFEQEEYVEKQGLLARMIHLFKSDNEDTQFLVSAYRVLQTRQYPNVFYLTNSSYRLLENNLVMAVIVFAILSLLLLSKLSSLLDVTSSKKNKTKFGKRRPLHFSDLFIKSFQLYITNVKSQIIVFICSCWQVKALMSVDLRKLPMSSSLRHLPFMKNPSLNLVHNSKLLLVSLGPFNKLVSSLSITMIL